MRTKVVIVLISFAVLVLVHGSTKPVPSSKNKAPAAKDAHNNKENNTGSTEAVHSDASSSTDNKVPTSPAQPTPSETADGGQGMKDSLADFIYDLLTESKNATQEKPAAASDGDTAQPSSPSASSNTIQEAGGTSEQSGGSTAVQDLSNSTGEQTQTQGSEGGQHENGGTSSTDQWSSTENFDSSSSETAHASKKKTINCDDKVDLRDFCGFTPDARDYFNNDTTTRGLQSPFISMDIVNDLMGCARGEWCLDNKLNVFKGMVENLYAGPLCGVTMSECIFDVLVLRKKCPIDKEFSFFVDALDLVCGLYDDVPTTVSDMSCFTHALAALHVTYADFLANNKNDPKLEIKASCKGHGFKMSKTYLCANNSCPYQRQYKSREAMKDFVRWGWFMKTVSKRKTNCAVKDEDVCGPLLDEATATEPGDSWLGMSTTSFWPQSPQFTFTTPKENGDENIDTSNQLDRLSKEDETLMVALSVATAVGLLFIVVGLIFWRRNRRKNQQYYYRAVSDSYDKVPSDEAHLLSRSSD